MSTLWSGRFTAEPDKDVFDYGKSLSVDRRVTDVKLNSTLDPALFKRPAS